MKLKIVRSFDNIDWVVKSEPDMKYLCRDGDHRYRLGSLDIVFFKTRQQAREAVKKFKNPVETVSPADMKIGEYGVIVKWRLPSYEGQIVCKFYGNNLVSISNPSLSWSDCERFTGQDGFQIKIISKQEAGKLLCQT